MLAGFPWVSAIVLYTLSWGWALLRPNTLYWDDWEVYFDKPLNNGIKTLDVMGRAPWGGLIEYSLLHLDTWAVTAATFFVFMACSLFVFLILRQGLVSDDSNVRLIVLLFLIVPVNHARIAVSIFDYTSSYFLFYLGWFVLVRYRSVKSFVLACVILFLSFKTHSFLFFVLLPFLHFAWLNKIDLFEFKKLNYRHLQVAVIAVMPFLYILLRELFWPPTGAWVGYQKPSIDGLIRWLPSSAPFILALVWFLVRRKNKESTDINFVIFWFGTGVTALALMPYFVGGLYRDYVSVIALRSDWGNRHQLLMPLGLALTAVGLNGLLKKHLKNLIFYIAVSVSLLFNLYFGSNYYLDSIKKSQVVDLFLVRNDLQSNSELLILDDTKRFNGRSSIYRDYEWSGLLKIAGYEVASVSGKRLCDQLPNANQLTLKSETPYLKALATRDLGLYFEVKPCSEVLAQNE
jgi:hypothetical protein